MNFVISNSWSRSRPRDLVQTDLDSHEFLKLFGDPFPGWRSKIFDHMAPEWMWVCQQTQDIVVAADINGKIVLAIDRPETYDEFLAFVDRQKAARLKELGHV